MNPQMIRNQVTNSLIANIMSNRIFYQVANKQSYSKTTTQLPQTTITNYNSPQILFLN